jgi:hypothetical protein
MNENENICITMVPDMLFCGLLIEMVIKQSDCIACLVLYCFDSSETVPRSNRVVSFLWIWIGICYKWPCGLMDKAPASGAGDCRFKSCQGRMAFYIYLPPYTMLPSIILSVCHCTSTGNGWIMKMYALLYCPICSFAGF